MDKSMNTLRFSRSCQEAGWTHPSEWEDDPDTPGKCLIGIGVALVLAILFWLFLLLVFGWQ